MVRCSVDIVRFVGRLLPRFCHHDCSNQHTSSSISSATTNQTFEGLLVMPRNYLSPGRSFQLLQALCTPEPCRVISSQPALWDSIAPLQMNHQSVILFSEAKYGRILTFSMTWQWSLMNKNVPLSGMLICIPINPSCYSACFTMVNSSRTICMPGKMMECNALAKVEGLLIESFPVAERCQHVICVWETSTHKLNLR